MSVNVVIELNPALDVEALAAAYASSKRIQVRNFLTPDAAQSVHGAVGELPWGLVYNDGPKVVQWHAHMLGQLDDRKAAEILAGISERARAQYQFLYSFYPILTAYFSPQVARHRAFLFYEFINSEPVLDLIREVTGMPEIQWADAQATWFKPGDFLKAHTDKEHSEGRVAAYVMNLSVDWERDWGGFLQFFDSDDNIEAAFMPDFNALNLFTIPQLHSVSMVSTYVTAQRLAVTGWFRTDEPPGKIGLG